MRQVKYAFLALILGVLAACTSLQMAQPTSPSQGIAYAYGTVAAVRTSAAQAVAAGTLSVADGQQVLTQTDNARATLDAAELAVASGDTTTAAGKLAAVTAALTSLQTFLQSKGVK